MFVGLFKFIKLCGHFGVLCDWVGFIFLLCEWGTLCGCMGLLLVLILLLLRGVFRVRILMLFDISVICLVVLYMLGVGLFLVFVGFW